MPERAGVDDNPDLLELIAVWRDASDDIDGRLKRIWRDIRREVRWVGDGTIRVLRLTAQAERLQELQATAEHQLDVLLQRSRSFLDDGPIVSIYSAGAEVTAAASGAGFSLTAPHRAAVEALARDTWSDVLSATRFVDRDAKRWVRRVSRKLTGVSIVAGDTALQAGRRFERDLAKEFRARGIGAVTYRDGSRHSFGEYAEMLLRTKTGVAYNAGTTNHARMVGVEWFELLDGALCFAPETELAGVGGLQGVARQYVSGRRMRRVRSGSHSVTVGPNHPMLTTSGFVKAGDLRPGDHLLHCSKLDNPIALALLDLQDRPATAQEIFESLNETMSARPASANDLHGDAIAGQGEIEIVRADWPLLDPSGLSDLFEYLRHSSFMREHCGLPLVVGSSDPSLGLIGVSHSSGSGMSSGDLSATGGVVHGLPDRFTNFGGGPLWDVTRGESPFDPWSAVAGSAHDLSDTRSLLVALADPVNLSIGEFAAKAEAFMRAIAPSRVGFGLELLSAGLASCHRISSIEDMDYSGWIYDAESRSGLLTLNGMVAANCGLSAHNDPQLANGLIVPLAVAQAYPLAHPNCVRAVAPRPDLTGPVGRSVVSVESRADQEAFEAALARQEAARARSGRRQRRRRQRRVRSTV